MAVAALVDRLSQTREAAPLGLRGGRLASRMGNTARRTQEPHHSNLGAVFGCV